MPRDHEFHELATRFSEAVLAAIGLDVEPGVYRASSLELKKSSLRVDLVFRPKRRDLPIVLGELQRRRDRDVDRTTLKKAVDFCRETGAWERTIVAVIYARPPLKRGVRPADVGPPHVRAVTFTPLRIVLTEVDPAPLEGRGGSARVLLPFVGTEARVRASARRWRDAIASDPTLDGERRAHALDHFFTCLFERLGKMDVQTLFPGEDMIEKTATGRALIRKGRARGRAEALRTSIVTVLRARFARVPPGLRARLDALDDVRRLQGILERAALVAKRSDLPGLLDED